MDVQVILTCILSSSLAVTIVSAIKEICLWRLNRKAKVADAAEAKEDKSIELEESINEIKSMIEDMQKDIQACKKSDKVLLQDKIKYLVLRYIKDGSVSYDDRKLVHEMWDIYHNGCGGNGDLNDIMDIFDELPIRA